jgi:capsular polysaccharide biosynthesis protein
VVERLNLFADADGNKVTIDEASHLLQKRVSLRAVGQDIFEISLIDERPQEAARIANAIAEAYRDFKSKHGGSVRIVAPAFPPESAIGPSFLLRAGLLFCGLAMSVAGCCVIFDRWPKTLATGAIRWLLRKKGSPPV